MQGNCRDVLFVSKLKRMQKCIVGIVEADRNHKPVLASDRISSCDGPKILRTMSVDDGGFVPRWVQTCSSDDGKR